MSGNLADAPLEKKCRGEIGSTCGWRPKMEVYHGGVIEVAEPKILAR